MEKGEIVVREGSHLQELRAADPVSCIAFWAWYMLGDLGIVAYPL